MTPPIGLSVTRVTPMVWHLGSSMVCEKLHPRARAPADPITIWQDGDFNLCLRRRNEKDKTSGDAGIDRIHEGGPSAAVWRIGDNTFCKVRSWCEGLELEADTISFVLDKAPDVPVPEVLVSWVDFELDRSFLILKRVPGKTLDQAWPELSKEQRKQVVDDVAQICLDLASNTSSQFQTASGYGVYEPWLAKAAPASHPSWLPRPLGPFSCRGLRAYMLEASTEPHPPINPKFFFYHADLNPTNIMVTNDGAVTIIDWESAAYFPKFWLATKPMYLDEFRIEGETDESNQWGQLLGQALEEEGYMPEIEAFRCWTENEVQE